MPVAGAVANGFGAAEPGGNPSAGLRIAAISGAIVVAPADAQVIYAGSFRDYGPTLILRTSRFDELARITPNVASAEYVVGERRVVDVPGDHLTMLSEPHVAAVAAAIEGAIAEIGLSTAYARGALAWPA